MHYSNLGFLGHVGYHLDKASNEKVIEINQMIDEYNRTAHSMLYEDQVEYQKHIEHQRKMKLSEIR